MGESLRLLYKHLYGGGGCWSWFYIFIFLCICIFNNFATNARWIRSDRADQARSAELAIFSWYPTRHKWNRCLTEFKPLEIRVKKIFLTFPVQRKLLFIRIYTRVIWRVFWPTQRHRNDTSRNFRAFETSLKFRFLVYNTSSLRRFC